MRRVSMLTAAAVAALALTAVAAGAASAAVVIKSGGVPLEKGAFVQGGIASTLPGAECVVLTAGTLASNGKTSDTAKLSVPSLNECSGTATASGSFKTVKISATAMKLTGKVTLTAESGCAYEIKKVEVPLGAMTIGPGETTAKRTKASSKTCAATVSVPLEGALMNEGFGPFEAEVI